MNEEYQNEEQRAARNAVMEIELFPELFVKLRKALGYGPHVEVMQHLIYWFNPEKEGMRNRWTLYKRFSEWNDECGLSRRQVNKGRETLRALGRVTEEKGRYKRIHYRVDWVALAKVLKLHTVAVQTVSAHQGGHGKLPTIGVQSNTREYAVENFSRNSLLQSGDGALSRAAPPQIKEQKTEQVVASPNGNKRHSQVIEANPRSLAKKAKDKLYFYLLHDEDTDVTALADKYMDCEATCREVAEVIRGKLKEEEAIEVSIEVLEPWVDSYLQFYDKKQRDEKKEDVWAGIQNQ